jgi:hypothetical protein
VGAILFANLFFSCQNEDCVSTFNNYLLVGFFERDTLEDGTINVIEKDTTFFAVMAIGNDSIFYDADTLASTFTLPVDPANDETLFQFYTIDSIAYDTLNLSPLEVLITYYPSEVPDVLGVRYDRATRVITEDCGVEIAFVNLKIGEVSFKDFNLAEDRLSRFNMENEEVNIEIFF